MGTKRRDFIKLGLAGAAMSLVKPAQASELVGIAFEDKVSGPVVISTWNHGIAANAEAWKVLQKGEIGRAHV
jgi:hypothetical protein